MPWPKLWHFLGPVLDASCIGNFNVANYIPVSWSMTLGKDYREGVKVGQS